MHRFERESTDLWAPKWICSEMLRSTERTTNTQIVLFIVTLYETIPAIGLKKILFNGNSRSFESVKTKKPRISKPSFNQLFKPSTFQTTLCRFWASTQEFLNEVKYLWQFC